MQGSIITVVDVPTNNTLVTITNVFSRAEAFRLAHGQCSLGELAGVDLLLDEEGDEVDEEGADDIRAHA